MRGFNEEDYCCCVLSEVLQCAGEKQNMDMDDAITAGTPSWIFPYETSVSTKWTPSSFNNTRKKIRFKLDNRCE
jgi:hypothetical protein